MGFSLIPGFDRFFHDKLDAKMTEMLKTGIAVAKANVHVDTGFLQSTIGGEYNKSTKTAMLHADAKYALIEEMRTPGDHRYLAYGVNAMAGFWGGTYNFELHFPNAAREIRPKEALEARERNWRKGINIMARRKTKLVVRRWHRRYDSPWDADEVTLIR